MDEVFKRIAEVRKSKGLTQKDICVKISMAQNSYSKIETGITELTIDHLIKIAGALGVSVVSLIDPEVQSKDYFQELNAKIEALEKTIQDKDEFIQLQKKQITQTKYSIIVALSVAEQSALSELATSFEEKRTSLIESMSLGVTATASAYIDMLKNHEILSEKEVELFCEMEQRGFKKMIKRIEKYRAKDPQKPE
ncbi:MAG: helix-turn-helix domain-containing protein [Bacteroidetes bacterium]|nr:helix-turn-helix domain-containing protein [Bacteroidota bacterium]MCL6102778.1 helix-turn-helix domain-containing protein [Bacteroidota bacterium]